MTHLHEMTVENLGPGATDTDLEQFKDWVADLVARDGLSESAAIDRLWGDGDYLNNASDLGLTS